MLAKCILKRTLYNGTFDILYMADTVEMHLLQLYTVHTNKTKLLHFCTRFVVYICTNK
jgi:hypothetical protein